MDSSIASLPPGDIKLTNAIVSHVKSQGLFDQIRRDCLADVDTKPAYQNLRQRVEGYVSNFLQTQVWRSDLNKNQLRDTLRRHINGSGMLAIGVDRIVEQVVNPKVNRVFYPQIESAVFKLLGKEPPPNSVTAALAMAQQMAAAATNEASNTRHQEAFISPPGTTDARGTIDTSTPVGITVLPPMKSDICHTLSTCASFEQTWMNNQDTSVEATTPPEIMSPPRRSAAEPDIETTTSCSSVIREIEEEIRLGQYESLKDTLSSSDSECRSSDNTGQILAVEAVKVVQVIDAKSEGKHHDKSDSEVQDNSKDNDTEQQEQNKPTVIKKSVSTDKIKSESSKKFEIKSENKSKITEKPIKQESSEVRSKVAEKPIKQDSVESKYKVADKPVKQNLSETKCKVGEKPIKQEFSNRSAKCDPGDHKKSKSSKSEYDRGSSEKEKKYSSSQGSKPSKIHESKGKSSDSNKAKSSEKTKTEHASTHKKLESSKSVESSKSTESSKSAESIKMKSSDHKSKSDDSSRDSAKSGLKSPTSKLKHSSSQSNSPDKSEAKAKLSAEKHKTEPSKGDKSKDDTKSKGVEKMRLHEDKSKNDKNGEEGKAKSEKPKIDDSRSKSVERSKSSSGQEKSSTKSPGKFHDSHKPKDGKDRIKSDSHFKEKKMESSKLHGDKSTKLFEGSKGKQADKHSSRADIPKRKDSTDKHGSRADSSKHRAEGDKHGSRIEALKLKDDGDKQGSRVDSCKRKDDNSKHSSRSVDSKSKDDIEKHGVHIEVTKRTDDTERQGSRGEDSKSREDKTKAAGFVKSKSLEKSSDKSKQDSKVKSGDLSKSIKDSSSGKMDQTQIKKRKNSDASKAIRDSLEKEVKEKSGDDKAKGSEKDKEKDKRNKSPAPDKHMDKRKREKSPISAKTPEKIHKLSGKSFKEGSSSNGEKRELILPSTSKETLKKRVSVEGISPLKKVKYEASEDELLSAPTVPREKEQRAAESIPALKGPKEPARDKDMDKEDEEHKWVSNMSDVTVSSVHTSDLSDYDDHISLTDTEGNEDKRFSSPEKVAKKMISPDKSKPLSVRGRGRPKKNQAPRGRKGRPPSFARDPPSTTHETPPSEKDSPQSLGKDGADKIKVGEGEPRRELRRQRKINPRYTSDEFASIFTKGRDKLHLGDSDEGQQDDEKDIRPKPTDEPKLSLRVSESPKEEPDKPYRGRKPFTATVSSEQSPLTTAEIPYSPRSDVSEADMTCFYRRPSKDRDSGGRTLSPKSDISADSSYSHLQGPQTPESTCSTDGKRRLPSAKHYDSSDLYKPRPPVRGGRRNRPTDHQRYDDSDLYKPRPVITASSRRCRGSSPPLTPELPSNTRRARGGSGVSPEGKPVAPSPAPLEAEVDISLESEGGKTETPTAGRKRKRSVSSSGDDSLLVKGKKDSSNVSDSDETASPDRRTPSESSETEPHKLFESPVATRGRRRFSTDQNTSHGRGRPPKDRSRRGRR